MCLLLTQLLLIGSLEITFGLEGFNLQSWTTFILKVLCRDTVQLGGWSVIGTQWTEVCFTCFDLSHTFCVEGKEREKGCDVLEEVEKKKTGRMARRMDERKE